MRLPSFLHREKVVSGVGTQENTSKLLILILGPFYGLYFGTYYMIEMKIVDETFGVMLFFVGLALEVAAMYGYNAKNQKEAAEHLNFDISKWRFHPEEIRAYDIFVKENGVQHVSQQKYFDAFLKQLRNDKEYKNGEKVAKLLEEYVKNREWEAFMLNLRFPLEAEHGRNGKLSIFTRPILLCEKHWRHMFHFVPGGETWYGNFPIDHPAHESLVVHVVDWLGYKGEDIPIGVVKDSYYHYKQTIQNLHEKKENNPDGINIVDVLLTKISFFMRENIGLESDIEVLEPQLKGMLRQPVNIDKAAHERMAAIKKRHGDIMRTEMPLKYRLINMKTFATIGVVLLIIFLLYMYLGG